LAPALEAALEAAPEPAAVEVEGDAVVLVQPASATAAMTAQHSDRSRIEVPPRVVWLDAATYQITRSAQGEAEFTVRP
jgi:hypothetical protein